MVNRLSGSLIKQPNKQEVAQDDTAPVLHTFAIMASLAKFGALLMFYSVTS